MAAQLVLAAAATGARAALLAPAGSFHSSTHSISRSRSIKNMADEKYVLTYFQVFARGPAPALALAHSGLPFKVVFPENWQEMKPSTPWGHLPLLEVPGAGPIGHEAAILNYIGRTSPKMGGASDVEFGISQQLIGQAEDMYQKLGKVQNTIFQKDKCSAEELEAVWSNADAAKNNAGFGLPVYLGSLEKYLKTCAPAAEGAFTASGVSVGECKLFATLHIMKALKDDVLAGFPGLASFYDTFAAREETKGVLAGTLNMTGPFQQYFVH